MVPSTPFGRLFGSICAIAGIFILTILVPVINRNFNILNYETRKRLETKKKMVKTNFNAYLSF